MPKISKSKKSSILDKLSQSEREQIETENKRQKHHSKNGLWKGPFEDGLTFSLISKFLVCRERFKLLVYDGLKKKEEFNYRIEYGNMWHLCQESLQNTTDEKEIFDILNEYISHLKKKYPTHQKDIIHWYNVCMKQFNVYLNKVYNPNSDIELIYNEKEVDIILNTGYGDVRLRGKIDGIFRKGNMLYIQENKTKSQIDERKIHKQLRYDMQTMLYLIFLQEMCQTDKRLKGCPNYGVFYNVVRRPLSGGKGTIVRHKPTKKNPYGESESDYYNRLHTIINDSPNYFFAQWEMTINYSDIENFKKKCLYPILEAIILWWMNIKDKNKSIHSYSIYNSNHWVQPYGIYNPLAEGYDTDYDYYIEDGSILGLERIDNLFPELST